MSESTVPARYTIAANCRWFAIVYTAVTVAVAALVELAYQNGIEIPTTGLNIGAFAGVTAAAGQRFASRHDWLWSSRERSQLALAYVALSIATSFALLGAFLVFDVASRQAIIAMVTQLGAWMLAILAIVALVLFGAARLTLGLIAQRGKRN